jgi:hypothetical protein
MGYSCPMNLEAVTRTHFTFRVDTWTPDGESIVEHVARRRPHDPHSGARPNGWCH